mmetsp:Transcript_8459/g.11674  ORF Transcript_8459/g.11674 Transcript_8459/m.11674 type:complete len:388 (+) Transcript_8459:1048-2211(+)
MNTRLSVHDNVHIKPCHTKISVREVSDEEKNATVRCINCQSYFKYDDNYPAACVHHHGTYVTTFSLPAWSCCKDIRSDYQGCCTSFHQEDVQTTAILEAIGERKQMVEEWHGKLDTKDIPIVIPGQKEGYLERLQNESSNKWQKLYFVLDKNRLFFYSAPKTTRLGEIPLRNAMYRTDKQYSWLEIIDTMTKFTCRLRADPPVELQAWKEALLYTTDKIKQQSSLHDDWIYISFQDSKTPYASTSNNNNNNDEGNTDKPDDIENDKFIIHPVSSLDTMQGLCIRYSTTPEAIMQANKMMNKNELYGFKTIRIPRDPSTPLPPTRSVPQESDFQKKRNATNRMMARCNLRDKEEAVFYLEECDWDLEKAVAMFNEDAKWHSTQDKRKK